MKKLLVFSISILILLSSPPHTKFAIIYLKANCMKKIFTSILIVFLINLFFPFSLAAMAQTEYKDVKGSNIQIVKKDKKLGLIEKDTQSKILPVKYDRIKKVKIDDKLIFICVKDDFLFTIYSPDGLYSDYVTKYIEANNILQNIKFTDYPKNGVIRYKHNKNYGLIIPERNFIHILLPIIPQIKFPDEDSVIAKVLNISFAPLNDIYLTAVFHYSPHYMSVTDYLNGKGGISGNLVLTPANIDEDITVENGKITVKYKNIKYNKQNKFYVNYNNYPLNNVCNLDWTEFVYNTLNEQSTYYSFEKYPKDFIILNQKYKTEKYLFSYINGTKNLIYGYDDYYISGANSLISQLNNGVISFQNLDNLIVKSGKKWGITDRNDNVKADFIYDKIIPLKTAIREKVIPISDKNNSQKYKIVYEGKGNDLDLYLVYKGKKYGVIDSNENIIVPIENVKYADESDFKMLNKQISKMQGEFARKLFIYKMEFYTKKTALFIVYLPAIIITLPLTMPFALVIFDLTKDLRQDKE